MLNLTGQRFGKLVVITEAGRKPNNSVLWQCQCDCGELHLAGADVLRTGRCTSCGCARVAAARKMSEGNIKHGHAAGGRVSQEYTAWKNMLSRCEKPRLRDKSYSGIHVCSRWKVFENFLEDMGCKPSPRHTLERRENSAGYEKRNCRWALSREQARNRSTNRYITFDGRTMIVSDWAAALGMPEYALRGRLHRGWSVERALTTPVIQRHRTLEP